MRTLLTSLLVLLCAVGCPTRLVAQLATDGETLDGEWLYHEGDLPPPTSLPLSGWKTMKVPSNWFTEGRNYAGVMWFARPIDVPADKALHAVSFEGADYAADVYLDGIRLGGHRGYFAPFRVALPSGVSGRRLLAVRIDSPSETAAAWSLRKTLIKGILSHHDTRPGNAWSARGQDANTGGIWGHVRMHSTAHGWVDNLRATTVEATPERATIRIEARFESAAHKSMGKLRYLIRDPDGRTIGSGAIDVGKDGLARSEVSVQKPRLWWPRDLGDAPLYSLTIHTADKPDSAGAKTVSFGIRTLARAADGRFVINGQPVFLRGTNYIASQYFASLPVERVVRDLDLMQSAHVNAIRVHAHVTAPWVYDLADQRGLLVWQDFPLQWGYDDSREFADEAARQAREMVDLLYNHPSILFWSGMNEAPFTSDWMQWKYPDYDPQQNRLLERSLRAAFAEADPTRPSQGNAHPAEHVWAGWYHGNFRDFAQPTPHTVITEYGAQALPAVSTLRTFLKEAELWPVEKNLAVWEYHDFQLHELRDIAKVPLGKNLNELVANTQRYQARVTQFAAENLRRQKWQPVTSIFQFMFVEHWPSMNWGVVDYLRNPKRAYGSLARAYQPLLPIASANRAGALALFVINDLPKHHQGSTLVARYIPESKPAVTLPAEIPANDVAKLPDVIARPGKNQSLLLELIAQDGTVLSRNSYEPGYFRP